MTTTTDWNERAARASGRDIPANRHRGNAMSRKAFLRIVEGLPEQRGNVLRAVEDAGSEGITCKELAARWKCDMNAISGRFSELKKAGLIEVDCARSGCSVYRLAVQMLCAKCNGNGEVKGLYGNPRTCNLCGGL